MTARAVTVTLNPAIDQTVRLARLQPGRVHRAGSSRDDAGGKGHQRGGLPGRLGRADHRAGCAGRRQRRRVPHAVPRRASLTAACAFRAIPAPTSSWSKRPTAKRRTSTCRAWPWTLPIWTRCRASSAPCSRPACRSCCPAACRTDCRPAWARLQAQAGTAGARVLLDTSGDALAAALDGARARCPTPSSPTATNWRPGPARRCRIAAHCALQARPWSNAVSHSLPSPWGPTARCSLIAPARGRATAASGPGQHGGRR